MTSNVPPVLLSTFLNFYYYVSHKIFDSVYSTSQIIIDEEYHLPLGLAYCKFDFAAWDPKVTTLPGLYLVSAVLLGPFDLCTTYWLRYISFIAAFFNIPLFFALFRVYHKQNNYLNVLSSFTLALCPPLFFFGNLYYTETVALMMVLLMLLASEKDRHFLASIMGFLAIIVRQTNAIWVGFVLGRYILMELYATVTKKLENMRKSNIRKDFPIMDVWRFARELTLQGPTLINFTSVKFWLDIMSYSFCLITFLLFVKFNGSIVVGDKSAHEATLHIPQLFYFSLFCLVFSWPVFLLELYCFLLCAISHKKKVVAIAMLMALIVFANTLVHPYLLADNRHYTFYVWNRFYGPKIYFRYLMIPIYMWAIYVMVKYLYKNYEISFLVMYIICLAAVLVTQKLLDLRYFLIPYVIFKLKMKYNSNTLLFLVAELITYVLMNIFVFYQFFYKPITWADYDEWQRLIW